MRFYQFSLLAFVINLIIIPYIATVIAHERMSLFAYLSILECILKLGVAIVLQFILENQLVVYAILIFVVAILVQGIYFLYCRFHFVECRNYRLLWNSKIGMELLTYSGWNVVGSLAIISSQQGLNVLLNLFFGTILNTTENAELAVNYGAAHGALAMTTPGDTKMASKKEVEAIMGGAGARVQR